MSSPFRLSLKRKPRITGWLFLEVQADLTRWAYACLLCLSTVLARESAQSFLTGQEVPTSSLVWWPRPVNLALRK